MFTLHPQLARDCHPVGAFELCTLLLMDDARYPWCILVPRRTGVEEIFQLNAGDRVQLLAESCRLGEALMELFEGDKLNVAALGNVVPQLHIHHVVRRRGDAAWPAPVWGCGAARAYQASEREDVIARLRARFSGELEP